MNDRELRIDEIKDMFCTIFNVIDDVCKKSRETSLAITKLEEAQFWAINGILKEVKNEDNRCN